MTAILKCFVMVIAMAAMLPLPVVAERPSKTHGDLRPQLPGDAGSSVRSLIRTATPVIPSRQRQKPRRFNDGVEEVNFFEPLLETPTCIVIANSTIGSASNVQQNTSVDTLNVNCN